MRLCAIQVYDVPFYLGDKYELIKALGRGAYGVVWYVDNLRLLTRHETAITLLCTLSEYTVLLNEWIQGKSMPSKRLNPWQNLSLTGNTR